MQIKRIHQEYHQYYPVLFFVLGFIFDVVTLGEIDDFSNTLSQTIFIVISAGLLKFELTNSPPLETNTIARFINKYHKEILHFCFGSLLNTYMLFYLKSSSLATSAVFLIMLCTLIIANEMDYFKKIGVSIRVILFSICLFSFFIAQLPLLIGTANAWIFFLSAILTSGTFYLIFKLFIKQKMILHPHLATVMLFIALYLFKIFPPLPLAIKSIYVFKKVEKSKSGYIATSEKPWWKFWQAGDQDYFYVPGDRVFVFTSVFAPGGYTGQIQMRWQKKINSEYQNSDTIPLTLIGGRREGFRGYSYKQTVTPGDWRVLVETPSGHEIGRINFEIISRNNHQNFEIKTIQL
jgi:hypothetical protein